MFKTLKKLFDNEYKELYRFSKLADEIDALDEEMSKLSDKKLASYTDKFKKRLEEGETLDDILVEAIALAREACFRAIGENPQTADAVGINISKLKYISILIGSMIAGLAGVFYVMCFVGGSYENSSTIQSFGWLSLALVIFTVWKPDLAILGSILFGFLFILPNTIEVSFVVMKVLDLLPYLVTIIVLIITSISGKKSVQPPSALGLAYFREDR